MQSQLVIGRGATKEVAKDDHDRNLQGLLVRCREKGVKLNHKKLRTEMDEVKYMGHILTAEGLKVDPEKIEAIMKMVAPQDVAGVQRYIGTVKYLSKFLPSLSSMCEPLRQLTKKDMAFCWTPDHDMVFQTIKQAVTKAPVLRYFDPKLELTAQCNASESGLGVALMQQGQPLAFASRALTQSERNYAQIEKELLAIVFCMEKFHPYLYGRPIHVESDHKPLEAIFKKPIQASPKRLQSMLLRLQRYDLTVTYKRGKEMYLADTLSRAYLPITNWQSARHST